MKTCQHFAVSFVDFFKGRRNACKEDIQKSSLYAEEGGIKNIMETYRHINISMR